MEISEIWEEFERLLIETDFDKIFQGTFQVPKPKEKPSEWMALLFHEIALCKN